MIALGWSRRHINASVQRITRMFRWAAEQEMLPGEIALNLRAVAGLKKGRSAAREKPLVGPVPDAMVEAVLPHLSPGVRNLLLVMRHSGMRPGEAIGLSVEAIDRSDPACWVYRLGSHKTEHHGKGRVVFLGPGARRSSSPGSWLPGRDGSSRSARQSSRDSRGQSLPEGGSSPMVAE